MKFVIFKSLGDFYITNEENYNSRVQNARKNICCSDFENLAEIINYFVENYKNSPEDFIVKC